MKKKIVSFLLMFILIIGVLNTSMAVENSKITLSTTKTSIQSGEEFIVIISQNYGSDIGAIEGNIEYNQTAFELIEHKSKSNWTNLNGSNKAFVSIIPNGEVNSGEAVELKFKALSNINNSKITMSNIKVYDEEGNLEESLTNQSVEITVTGAITQAGTLTGISITNGPTTTTYTEGSIFDPTGMEITATYSNNTTKPVTNYTYSPSEPLTVNDTFITISYTENGITQTITTPITVNANMNDGNNEDPQQPGSTDDDGSDNRGSNKENYGDEKNQEDETQAKASKKESADTTMANGSLPKTGATTIVFVVILGTVGIGLIFYKKYQKYKNY